MGTEERAAAVATAFVSSHARNGGAERYLEALLDALPSTWVRLVVSLEAGPHVERLRRQRDAKVIPTGPGARHLLRSAWRLRRLFRNTRPDVVHANGVKAAIVAILATAGTPISVVWVRHDFSFDGRVARLVARRCRLTVCVSNALASGLPRTRTIYTPVLGAATRDTPTDLPEDVHRVVLVGYFHPVKGQADLVEVAPTVLERIPDAHFLFVGGEDRSAAGYRDKVRRRISELGLEDRFTFLGQRADAVAIVRACDLALVLTGGRGEGFGLAALEALSVGTPVIGYATGALPEIVGDCGRLLRPGDLRQLATAIVELLSDQRVRSALAACGEQRVRAQFSGDRWVAKIIEAYREAA
jgi:glycosyltransferase involved in cell wall biosynthesis